jgi:hypothetical protein
MIAEIDRVPLLLEDDGRRLQLLRLGVRIFVRIRWSLGKRYVSCFLNEAAKLLVGGRVFVHPESAHRDGVGGRFLGVMVIGTHQEGAARNPDHIGERRAMEISRTRRPDVIRRYWPVSFQGFLAHCKSFR